MTMFRTTEHACAEKCCVVTRDRVLTYPVSLEHYGHIRPMFQVIDMDLMVCDPQNVDRMVEQRRAYLSTANYPAEYVEEIVKNYRTALEHHASCPEIIDKGWTMIFGGDQADYFDNVYVEESEKLFFNLLRAAIADEREHTHV